MNKKSFEIYVAIGSSAGGFEALSQLVTVLPKKTGFFYFLAQHHARGEKSILVELLGRKSTIEVVLVTLETIFKPDVLYVLPPELQINIQNGKPVPHAGEVDAAIALPNADLLFHKLSTIKNSKIIAVLLSGSGADGTEGMRAVKKQDGITIVQLPEESIFSSMPKSAIHAKVVDYILNIRDIAIKLQELADAFAQGIYNTQETPFETIAKILHKKKYLDLSQYKEETIFRRIQKRINTLNLANIEQYAQLIQEDEREIELLHQEVLIGVTQFFRGLESFDALAEIIKKQLQQRKENSEFRLWSVACSSGEEAYSLAIIVNEISQALHKNLYIKIFATDIDEMSLEKARLGQYSTDALENMPNQWRKKYFIKTEYGYKVVKILRDQIIFAQHNFLNNPPFINIDLISCRNVLIYLKSSVQSDVFSIFHYSLNNDGLLFLGSSESILNSSDFFVALDSHHRIYQKKEQHEREKFPLPYTIQSAKAFVKSGEPKMREIINPIEIEKHLQQDVYNYFSNGSLIIDCDYNIVYKKGNVPYLNFSEGLLSLNIYDNLDKILCNDMRIIINKVLSFNAREMSKFIQLEVPRDEEFVQIIAQPFYLAAHKPMILIYFQKIKPQELFLNGSNFPAFSENTMVSSLSSQLIEVRKDMQSISDELKFSKQNMAMVNEELQDSNEKLQSAVEELETSNEELRASNEELQVSFSSNRELQNKLSHILESSLDGILGLDMQTRHTFVNKKAAEMLGYSAEYLIGKESHKLWHHTKPDGSYYPEAECPIARVLSSGEKARGEDLFWRQDGTSFAVEFIRSPIIENGKITGAVVNFYDITEKKELESKIKNEHEQMLTYLEISGLIILILDINGNIVNINQAGINLIGLDKDEIIGLNMFDNFIDDTIQSEVKEVFDYTITDKTSFKSHHINKIFDANKQEHLIAWNNTKYKDDEGKVIGVIATGRDITKEEYLVDELQKVNLKYEQTFKAAQIGIAHVAPDGSWLDVNEYLCRLVGYTKEELLKLKFQDITHAEDLDADLGYVSQLLEGKRDNYHMEKRYIRKNKNIVWVHISVVLLRDSFNQPLYFISIIQDISQVKLLMLELESKKNELGNIIRFAPNPIMLHSEDGAILMVNEAFSQITGYTLKELSTTEQWRQKTKGIKKNMDVLEIDKFFEDNIRVNMGEVTITTKNNQKLVWIVSLAPLGNVYNGKRVMIYSAMDITQMHENEELMLAQSRQAAMGDMIGMIAHQWRQPLSIIAMVANNLKASLELEEEISSSEIDKLTGILTEQTQYLSHTIDDFRTFFKPEKQKEKIILCKIYEKLGNMIETLLENNKINLHFVNECEVVLYTYPNELIQVMINLINNAKDAIIERDVQDGKIEITTTFTVDLLSIVVSDNAGGIDESIIDKLGEPYVTTKSANGTGLGIYMSLIILQKHFEGHLTWKNCNRGSCFTIELPLKNLEEEA